MKKYTILVALLIAGASSYAQRGDFTDVDNYAASIGYYRPDTLANLLTKPYTSELKKVRSIFYWITHHISYDVPAARGDRHYSFYYHSREDSARQRRQMVYNVVTKRKGICEDYATLFRMLCEYAKIKAVMVTGYARSGKEITGNDRQPDHAWNAVMIDNKWYLLDATWASGFINHLDAFVPQFNEYYFLTEPELMKMNHLPEDNKWLLTKSTFSLDEFFSFPIIYFDNGQKNNHMRGFYPQNGKINVSMGGSIKLAFDVDDTSKVLEVVGYPDESTHPSYTSTYMDYAHQGPAVAATGSSAPAKRNRIQVTENIDDTYFVTHRNTPPSAPKDDIYTPGKNRVVRTYQFNNPITRELHVYYNDELMLRYMVNITK